MHEYRSLFWRDVIFYKQIAWKVSSLFWWCQCFLLVDAHLGISASKQTCSFDFIKFHLIWVMMIDGLLLCTKRPWLINYFFLVGELLIWFTFIFYTKHWCPFTAFDNFEIHSWMGAWVGPGWVRPWAWGCPAGVLPTRPWCHFSKKHKMSFTRNSNI